MDWRRDTRGAVEVVLLVVSDLVARGLGVSVPGAVLVLSLPVGTTIAAARRRVPLGLPLLAAIEFRLMVGAQWGIGVHWAERILYGFALFAAWQIAERRTRRSCRRAPQSPGPQTVVGVDAPDRETGGGPGPDGRVNPESTRRTRTTSQQPPGDRNGDV